MRAILAGAQLLGAARDKGPSEIQVSVKPEITEPAHARGAYIIIAVVDIGDVTGSVLHIDALALALPLDWPRYGTADKRAHG